MRNFTLIRESRRPCGAKNSKIGHLSNFNTGGCPAGKKLISLNTVLEAKSRLKLQKSF